MIKNFARFALCAALVLGIFALAGCGGGTKEKADVTLATVGSKDITSGYYEDRLVKLEEKELPRAEDGSPLDMSLPEGKGKFSLGSSSVTRTPPLMMK